MKIIKELELRFKDFISSLINKILRQPSREIPDSINRILFFRYDVLGDMILSMPVLKVVRKRYPNAEVHVLCSLKNYKLLEDSNLADQLYTYKKSPFSLISLVFKLRKNKYDLIINLVTHASFTFGLVARLGGPKAVRIAGQQEQFSYLYNHRVDIPPKNTTHMLKLKFILCSELVGEYPDRIQTPWVTYGPDLKDRALHIRKTIYENLEIRDGQTCLVGINLSAGMARREWPLDKYAHFLKDSINKYKDKIDGWVILGNPSNPEKAEQLQLLVNNPKLISVEPQNDFRVVLELLPSFRLIISPDTSVVHAASAMGTPVCVMTIGQSGNVWNPVGVPYVLIRSDDYYSLQDLPVTKVTAGFNKLIKKLSI